MSMYSYIEGGKPADDKYKQMAAIWEACKKAGIKIPEEVAEFLDHKEPDGNNVWVQIGECVTEGNSDSLETWTVDIGKLPTDIKLIRFVNSY